MLPYADSGYPVLKALVAGLHELACDSAQSSCSALIRTFKSSPAVTSGLAMTLTELISLFVFPPVTPQLEQELS